ncbi:hypothetical protein [Rugamonas aquatica]|uniref:Uncharacterized protein n=1 Tax=Rugamonas aquatica TaxID=2743357 RepID=A0A6A7N688_9BURK|nr:hypothetical protein [Rugamonas aquatica]MQA40645.1 hypothetical protein [Rugamonas aquatica]
MNHLHVELMALCHANPDGDPGTWRARIETLALAAAQLEQFGYAGLRAHGLGSQHIDALLGSWYHHRCDPTTLQARTEALRWWADKVGRRDAFRSGPPQPATTHDDLNDDLSDGRLRRVHDHYARASLALAMSFGLRKFESVAIRPAIADSGTHLVVAAISTPQPRMVPIATPAQRIDLDFAKKVAGLGQLAPRQASLRGQVESLRMAARRAGIPPNPDLRRNYAHLRYLQITGRPCAAAGGPSGATLNAEDHAGDRLARQNVLAEMGYLSDPVPSLFDQP